MSDGRALDALRGMVGLVQLVNERYPDFPVDNHRVLAAMSAISEAEHAKACPQCETAGQLLDTGYCAICTIGHLQTQVKALQQVNASRPEGGAWVSVEDWLPDVHQLVIAFTDKYGCLLADRTTSNPDHGWSCDGKVTHWMPIPNGPTPQVDRD